MTAALPECPAADAFHEADRNRHLLLEGLAAGKNGEALTSVEVDELMELRGRWSRYLVHRGHVEKYLSDQKKDEARPVSAADPENAIGQIMRERRQGRRSDLAERASNTFEGESLAHGHNNPLAEPGRRSSGRGTDRIQAAINAGADRLEKDKGKNQGFVW